MKRSKQNCKYWQQLRWELYDKIPSSQLVKNRYKSLKALLGRRYPEIKNIKQFEDILKDAIYLDRQIRADTEGREVELKKILAQEAVLELDK